MSSAADERPSGPVFDVCERSAVVCVVRLCYAVASLVPIKSHGTVGPWPGHSTSGNV